jgi:microcystin-dependent protein
MPTIKNTQKQNFSSNVVIGNGTDVVEGLTVYGNISTNGNSYTSGLTAKSIYSDNVKFDQLTANNILGPALTAIAPTFVSCFNGSTIDGKKVYELNNEVGNNVFNYLVFLDGQMQPPGDAYSITGIVPNCSLVLTDNPGAKKLTVLGLKNGNVTGSDGNTVNPALGDTDYAPIGTVMYFARSTPPAGWLVCDGTTQLKSAFPDLGSILGNTFGTSDPTTFILPDLRGEFIRGWSSNRADVDNGRQFGQLQLDELKSHQHLFYDLIYGANANDGGANGAQYSSTQTKPTSSYGGVETRPRNIALLPCIKAFHSYALNSVPTNISTITNNYVTKGTYESDFTVLKMDNGYQKLKDGLLLQWGTVIFTKAAEQKTFNFPIGFSSAPFMVTTTIIRNSPGGSDALVVYWDKQNTTKDTLSLVTDNYGIGTDSYAVTATYMAIGI